MSDETSHSVFENAVKENGLSLLIDAVAARAARKAIKETFFLLGTDLDDPEHVRSTRDVLTDLRDNVAHRQRRKEAWSHSFPHGFMTLVAGVMLAVGGFLVSGRWPHQ